MENYKRLFEDVNISETAKKLSFNKDINDNKNDYVFKAISFIDLTTLEGNDTFDKVGKLCERAINPSNEKDVPACAAICIYPRFINYVSSKLKGTNIKTATVATSFPSGQVPIELKLQEVKYCIEEGADEVDMVISRGEFLSNNYKLVSDEIAQISDLCKTGKGGKSVHLKVILETGELKTTENIYLASVLAINAGADFIKTSTGKISPAATLEAAYVMLNVIKDHFDKTGKRIGFKPAGGIRTTEEALQYISLVKNILGDEWLTPGLFRIGASSLLNNLLEDLK
ncbi:MAG: deoxyribose-phosphate aldolase [Ignavibacteria bacterium]